MSKTAVVIDIIAQVRRGFGGSFRRAVLNYKEVQKKKEWWELGSVPFVVTCGVISAVVVMVAAVADSAVSWNFRWPGGLWRPLLGLSEHAEPRW